MVQLSRNLLELALSPGTPVTRFLEGQPLWRENMNRGLLLAALIGGCLAYRVIKPRCDAYMRDLRLVVSSDGVVSVK